ncbi:MAG: ATP synthase subunit I [Atribacterota bacterium]|nr:ATP synthase subunit I [Atribacterota bacterium]MDD4765652.1 ATP synthase subunit I [Atribacterota bacterium]MDI9596878.1 ATP synthase subunit I [Atribacterota bacterium]
MLGFLSGLFYFGGLWFTLQYMVHSRYPAVITLLSYILRVVVSFFILLYIARFGDWAYILYWLAGFILARIILSRLLGDNYPEKNKKEQ